MRMTGQTVTEEKEEEEESSTELVWNNCGEFDIVAHCSIVCPKKNESEKEREKENDR